MIKVKWFSRSDRTLILLGGGRNPIAVELQAVGPHPFVLFVGRGGEGWEPTQDGWFPIEAGEVDTKGAFHSRPGAAKKEELK